MSKSNAKSSNATAAKAATKAAGTASKAPRAPRKGKSVDVAPQPMPEVVTPEVVTHPLLAAAGVEVTASGTLAPRKIEKDRPEANGVKQPSAGGMCRAVWDFCTSASAETLVTATQVKAAATANGWNPNNAMIEYYQWRKFNGIRGRQAKAPAATEVAPAPAA